MAEMHCCLQLNFPWCFSGVRLVMPSIKVTQKLSWQVNIFSVLKIHEIHVMAWYASLISADLPQIHLWSKYDSSIPFGFLETELYRGGDFFSLWNDPWNIGRVLIWIAAFSRIFSYVSMDQNWKLLSLLVLTNWAKCNRWLFFHRCMNTCMLMQMHTKDTAHDYLCFAKSLL